MKKVILLAALLVFQTQVLANETANTQQNIEKKPAQTVQQQTTQVNQEKPKVRPASKNEEYLLKYNINDLEAAPWLNNGERKI